MARACELQVDFRVFSEFIKEIRVDSGRTEIDGSDDRDEHKLATPTVSLHLSLANFFLYLFVLFSDFNWPLDFVWRLTDL